MNLTEISKDASFYVERYNGTNNHRDNETINCSRSVITVDCHVSKQLSRIWYGSARPIANSWYYFGGVNFN